LIKNDLIGLLPIDAKLAKSAVFSLNYPTILGISFAGTVAAVGSDVSGFNVGDRVTAAKLDLTAGDESSAFQQYVVARAMTTSKIPQDVELDIPVSLVGNLGTVVGLFTLNAGLEKPDPEFQLPCKDKAAKILVYGGTSNFGSLSVQYVSQAGYKVVTTTSPKHESFVSKLGAFRIIDHTQDQEALLRELVSEGPYDLVVDAISIPSTIAVTAAVLSAQGGGELYAMQPAFSPETLPRGVTRKFASWSVPLGSEEDTELLKWAYGSYLPRAVAKGRLVPLPSQKVPGGLGRLNEALTVLNNGVSGVKVVIEPWE
jgi:NADPH:quinone reductase-like Zn-dependent oxidoreductase